MIYERFVDGHYLNRTFTKPSSLTLYAVWDIIQYNCTIDTILQQKGKKFKRVKKIRIKFLVGLFVIFVGASIGLWFYCYAITPVEVPGKTAAVWVRPGQTFFETLAQLKKARLIRSPKKFRWLAYLQGYERQIRAGEYELSSSMSPGKILNTLVHGRIVFHKVVVPEGVTVSKIGELLDEAGLIQQEVFYKTATTPGLASNFGLQVDSLEGYLFPETYYFPKGVSAEQVINKMVDQFRAAFSQAWLERAKEIGLTVHEVVTLASIVEKETAKSEERPLIAAVFLNRLKHNMRLESDPTVIYGMKSFKGNITRKDLKAPTPYNTYRIKGLPPGPIANPGKASIEAVLYPAKKPYLYFVSKNDGSHHFSRTFSEHQKMVRQYQLPHR